jgi:asparagine synthase (glutamine-hydrolysing)
MMCGICGIARPHGAAVEREEILRMRDAMAHRGPDAAGFCIAAGVGLGHRRLKIIDLSPAGDQPMSNEDGSVVITFNGEIYNHRALRAELEARGHQFRSHCDTEVVVHGYEEWGDRCPERLNGMFAFAIHDRRRAELFLARDHFGIKPLYYHHARDQFLFASEIKAFFGAAGFEAQLNDAALPEYLLYRSLTGTDTLYRDVHMMPPGHTLRVTRDGAVRLRRYWDIEVGAEKQADRAADQQCRLLQLLQESVAMQQMSDVPIGAQLSGGVDSSLITALMAAGATAPVHTYAVGFPETRYSELAHARLVARQLGTDHHEVVIHQDNFVAELDQLSWQMDEPLAHANSVGIAALCREAKASATVLLTGEGADEAFAGYHRHQNLRKAMLARRWLGGGTALFRALPGTTWLRAINQALAHDPLQLIARSTMMGGAALQGALDPAAVDEVVARRVAVLDPVRQADWLDQALYYDIKAYLPAILIRQDKMSMAVSVETRVPFLDPRLVEMAFALPRGARIGGGGKRILKTVAGRVVPREVVYRPKVGFAFPLQPWLAEDRGLGQRVAALADAGTLATQLLGPKPLRRLIERRHDPSTTNSLWTLLALESWRATAGTAGQGANPMPQVTGVAAPMA